VRSTAGARCRSGRYNPFGTEEISLSRRRKGSAGRTWDAYFDPQSGRSQFFGTTIEWYDYFIFVTAAGLMLGTFALM
jgi:hypothetical protein